MLVNDVPSELANRTAVLLRTALVRAEAAGEDALTTLGLSGREYGVMALIREDGARTSQRGLGTVLGIDRTTTMKLVTALERRGLVLRHVDPADRRVHRLRLSSEGERLTRSADRVLAQCDDALTDGRLSPAEGATLRDLLRRLT